MCPQLHVKLAEKAYSSLRLVKPVRLLLVTKVKLLSNKSLDAGEGTDASATYSCCRPLRDEKDSAGIVLMLFWLSDLCVS